MVFKFVFLKQNLPMLGFGEIIYWKEPIVCQKTWFWNWLELFLLGREASKLNSQGKRNISERLQKLTEGDYQHFAISNDVISSVLWPLYQDFTDLLQYGSVSFLTVAPSLLLPCLVSLLFLSVSHSLGKLWRTIFKANLATDISVFVCIFCCRLVCFVFLQHCRAEWILVWHHTLNVCL